MSYLKLEEMPEVTAILRKAEDDIKAITGAQTFLAIDAFEIKRLHKDQLKNMVCEYFNYKWEEIIAKDRPRELSDALYVYMYLARKEFHCTIKEIANDCGNRHHTSVLNGLNKIEGFYKVGDRLIFDIEAIKKLLKKRIK